MSAALFKWLWANDGVGNFTASAILYAAGGRWVWTRHVKPHLRMVRELHARHITHERETE